MLVPNTILQNRYRIIRLLGQGGMGAVYQAQDLRLSRPVAIKENVGGDPRQFQQEALILANLNHPNLPRVSDHFVELSTASGLSVQYLVMDFVEGEDLQTHLERQQRIQAQGAGSGLPEAQVRKWFEQILDAVGYLHNRGVIHRDIKPANVKITPAGQAMLVDFGIAKVYEPGQHTRTGARMGSPGFAAPEQYGGGTDRRSDIYALGATLYALLTGRMPPESMYLASGSALLVPPRRLNPALSAQAEQVILKAMAAQPGQRFQNTDEMRRALQSTIIGTVALPATVATVAIPQTWRRVPQSNRLVLVLAGLAAVILVCLAGGLLMAFISPPPTPQIALATRTPTATPIPATFTSTSTSPAVPGVTATTVSPAVPEAKTYAPPPVKPSILTPSPTRPVEPTDTPTRTSTPRPTATPTESYTSTPVPPAWPPFAFASSNGVWVASGKDSAPIRLTDSSVNATHPEFSPNGQWIAYELDHGDIDIYIMRSDRSDAHALTSGQGDNVQPAFSPDSTKILFSSNRDDSNQIYVMNADGSNQRRVGNLPDCNFSPHYAPDASLIVFARTPCGSGAADIWLMQSDGSGARQLTHDGKENEWPRFLSPEQIVFQSKRSGHLAIYVMNLDGSGLRQVTQNPQGLNDFQPSPLGGKFLAFAREQKQSRGNIPHIFMLDLSSGEEQQLTNLPGVGEGGPTWGR